MVFRLTGDDTQIYLTKDKECSLCRPFPNRYFTSPAGLVPRLIFGIMHLIIRHGGIV